MTDTPDISIIVPIYNTEEYLPNCIVSILNQTYNDFELLLINDGSKDKSGEICDKYAKKDNRIKVFHKQNSGVSSTRNIGIKNAKGKYIFFIDSDDWIEKDYLESFITDAAIEGITKLVIHDVLSETKSGSFMCCNFKKNIFQKQHFSKLFSDVRIYKYGFAFAKLYYAKIIKDHNILFDEKIHYSEDLIFMLEYLKYIECVIITPSAKYHYTNVNPNSLIHTYHSFEVEYYFYQKFKEKIQEITRLYNLSENARNALKESCNMILTRVINSLYRPKFKKNMSERLKALNGLIINDMSIIKYDDKKVNNLFLNIGFAILKEKKIFLFDIYINLIFFARYKFEKLWFYIR